MVTASVRIVNNFGAPIQEKVFLHKGQPQAWSAFTSLSWSEAADTHRVLGELLAKRALCKTASTA